MGDHPPRFPFPKTRRLLWRSEFLRVQRQGKRVDLGIFLACVLYRPGAEPRLGLTTSRKVGKAVFRNRLRRLARDSARRLLLPHPFPVDVVLIARRNLPRDLKQQDDDRALHKLLSWLERRFSTRGAR